METCTTVAEERWRRDRTCRRGGAGRGRSSPTSPWYPSRRRGTAFQKLVSRQQYRISCLSFHPKIKTYQFHFLVPSRRIVALCKSEPKETLVYLEESFGHSFQGEVLLQLLLVDGVPRLLDLVHVVTKVPEVHRAVKLVAVPFALQDKVWSVKQLHNSLKNLKLASFFFSSSISSFSFSQMGCSFVDKSERNLETVFGSLAMRTWGHRENVLEYTYKLQNSSVDVCNFFFVSGKSHITAQNFADGLSAPAVLVFGAHKVSPHDSSRGHVHIALR